MKTSLSALLFAALVLTASVRADEPKPAAPAATSTAPASLPASAQVRNVQFGLLLRPRDASNKDGTPLVLYPAQPWKCMTWTTHASDQDGLISLQNRFTSKTFAAADNGTIRQIPFDAAKLWRFEKLADGTYRILDPAIPGKTLTAKDENTLVMDDWRDTSSQKWEILPAPAHLTM